MLASGYSMKRVVSDILGNFKNEVTNKLMERISDPSLRLFMASYAMQKLRNLMFSDFQMVQMWERQRTIMEVNGGDDQCASAYEKDYIVGRANFEKKEAYKILLLKEEQLSKSYRRIKEAEKAKAIEALKASEPKQAKGKKVRTAKKRHLSKV